MRTKHLFVLINIRNKGEVDTVKHVKTLQYVILMMVPMLCSFCGSFLLFMFDVVYHTVMSVPCSLVVTCWERADLLALLYVTYSCVFCHFPIWCPGLGVVFDCNDSQSLPSSLLILEK